MTSPSIRPVPWLATIVVAIAVAVMIGLGVWQLQRAQWKEGLLAIYARAATDPPIAWPAEASGGSQVPLFRHATTACFAPAASRSVAGENLSGEPGFVHIVECAPGKDGSRVSVEIGWSKNPNAKWDWAGGPVSGSIAPDRVTKVRLVAATPAPGLEASKPPALSSIPNNHRFYAVQWFLFAAIALIIYALALRRRMTDAEIRQQ